MPSFLQISFMAGLAALAVPVLIHLFFRLRTKRVELGTIRFLRVVLEENARRRKVMRWFLLALRMACIALLVVLFARPYFTAAASGQEQGLLVVLIDRSASMQVKGEGGRLFDHAVSEARRVIEQAHPRTRIEMALFDHRVHPRTDAAEDSEAKGDSRSPLEWLTEAQSTPLLMGATNYGMALAWARDILIKAPAGEKQLHVWTDLQRSGLDWTEVDPIPADVEVHLHDLGRPVVNNVAVTELQLPRTWIRPDESTVVQATVVHGGSFTLEEVAVALEVGRYPGELDERLAAGGEVADFSRLAGRISQRERIKLVPGASVSIDFELPPLAAGWWVGRVTLEYDDDLAFDNRRYFAVAAAPAYRVLVVTGDDTDQPLLGETYFLEAALRLSGPEETFEATPFAPEVLAYNASSQLPELDSFRSVILANVAQLTAADAGRLAAFVQNGGGLLVFTGDRATGANLATLSEAGLGVGKIGEIRVTRDLPWRWERWDDKHPVFRDLSDPQHGDLRQLIFAAYTQITPDSTARVLAEFRSGEPAVLERSLGKGSVLWVTTSCGREWSNWTGTRLFVPIVHQLLGYQVGLTAGGRVRTRLLDVENSAAASGAGGFPLPDSSTSRSENPGVQWKEGFVEVTNVSPRESETELGTRDDFQDRFGMQFADDGDDVEIRPRRRADVEFHPDEVWHWVACLVLCGILLEGFVGNRTAA